MGVASLSCGIEKQNQTGQAATFDSYNSCGGRATELSPRESNVDNRRESNPTRDNRERWDRLARHYGLVERLSERYLQAWRSVLWKRASGRVLEMGAGTGLNLPYYPAGADITACDLSGGMLGKAVERARSGNARVRFCEADICRLPFPDAAFDTAAATFVFCSLADPVPCMREMGRVTKADGQVLLLDHVRIDRPVIGPLMDLLNAATVRFAGEHINHRTEELARAAGLEIVESLGLGFMGILRFIAARPVPGRS
jgi:ubiquinone/menaquinone biosynthesis C-methylase UbiE